MSTVFKPRWYNLRQAAAELGYSVTKTKGLISTGALKSIKDGGNRRILPRWIDEYIEAKAAEIEELCA